LPQVRDFVDRRTSAGPKKKSLGSMIPALLTDYSQSLALAVLAPLMVDLGGMLRCEAMDARYRRYKVLWFFDVLGESLKLAEVDSWMAEHFFSLNCAR
jgi:hypothetical protein